MLCYQHQGQGCQCQKQGQHPETAGISKVGEGGHHQWQHSPPLHVCFDIAITRVAQEEGRDAQLSDAQKGCYNIGTGVGAVEDGSKEDSEWWRSKLGGGGATEEGCVPRRGSSGSNIDEGVVLVSGATHNVHVGLLPGRTQWQPLLLSFTRPGLYQVHVTNVAAVPLQLPQQRDPTQQPRMQQGGIAGCHMGVSCSEGDDDTLNMAVAASVLRGSLMGRAALAPAPAWVDALNVLALAPAPTEGSHDAYELW